MKQRINYAQVSSEYVKKLSDLSLATAKGQIERSLIDLINLRASQINGCAFCVDMHTKEAKIHGEKELRLHHVVIWRESQLFTPRERAALAWTEAVTKISDHGTTDELYDHVRSQFSESELSDLTICIAVINAWNRLAVSFQREPGSMDKFYGLEKAGL